MPVLQKAKDERFAQESAQGKSNDEAYVLAGFKSNRAAAWRKRQQGDIKQRIEELLDRRHSIDEQATERAIQKLAISKETVLGELAKIGFANMQDYMTVGPDGSPTLNFKDLTRDQAAALVEVTVEEFRDGRTDSREVRRVKFKLADKRSALVDLGKHLGLFIERVEVGDPGAWARMTDTELDQDLIDQAGKLGIPKQALAGLLTWEPPVEPEDDGEAK